MYYIMGRQPTTGLIIIKSKQGSSKKAINKIIMAALMTTAKLSPDVAYGEHISLIAGPLKCAM